MSELPKGWVNTSISQITNIQNGYAFKSETYTKSGDFVIRIGNVQDGFLSLSNPVYVDAEQLGVADFKLETNDILMSLTGNVGRVAVIEKKHLPAVLNQRVAKLSPTPLINLRWFYYFLRTKSFMDFVYARAKGAAQLNISTKDIELKDIPIPPQAEQTRIVEKLDEVLAQVDTIKARLDGIPAILKRFRQSVLAAAVSGRLTEEADLCTWVKYKLSDIVTFQNGYAFKSDWFTNEGDYQVIKLANVKDDFLKLDAAPAFLSSSAANEFIKFKPNVGDILISMTGTKFKRDYGFACSIKTDMPLLINQRVGRLIPNSDLVDSHFLHLYIRSEVFRNQFFKGETGGVNQGNVGSGHILSCSISIPNMNLQKIIADKAKQYFAFADTIEAQVKKAQARVDNLTQSILAKAFRGELVAQDPDDEPAEKLLERIAQARKEAEALAKAAKKVAKTK